MHDIRKINVMENIMDENDHIAEHVNEHMSAHGVLVINEMGAPGVGKTTTLRNIISRLDGIKPYVIEGDIESDLDTQTLRELGIDTHQINTFGACHLDAPMIDHMIDHMHFDHSEQRAALFIENIGNLVCPAEFSIGEHIKMLISTVTEGSDKPYKYPLAFEKADVIIYNTCAVRENADVIILNKVDLIPYLDFDEEFFMKGVRALNKDVPVFKVSGKTGEGFDEVAEWIKSKALALEVREHHHDHEHDHHHNHEHK